MIVEESDYSASGIWKNPYLQTAYVNLFRSAPKPPFIRERLELPDGDFVDLDHLRGGHDRLVILLPGLEGNFQTPSVRSMAHSLHQNGWDLLLLNHRGCGGEVNRLLRSYHSGFIDDLGLVLQKQNKNRNYRSLATVGLSLGGNILLKYLGNRGAHTPSKLKVAAAISAPVDLSSTVQQLMAPSLRWYQARLARRVRSKILQKIKLHHINFPEKVARKIRNLQDLDHFYTAPVHGFRSKEEYWKRSSSRQYLKYIKLPTLLINAADDPFLAEASYPEEEARANPRLLFEMPSHGGHLGFVPQHKGAPCWHEQRVIQFLENPDPHLKA